MTPSVDPHSADRALAATGLLKTFNDAGVIGAAEVHAATRLYELYRSDAEPDENVRLGLAIALRALRAGSVCVDLRRAHELVLDAEVAPDADLPWPEPDVWWASLMASGLVDDADAPDTGAPLRRRGGLLYPARHFNDEENLRAWLNSSPASPTAVDGEMLRSSLDELFDGSLLPEGSSDQQRLAAVIAAHGSRLVLAGGPGTGKTRTVARILAVLARLHAQTGETNPPRVALAAPTGKAAARLTESIIEARGDLPPHWSSFLDGIPAATTLHRLLGYRPSQGFTRGRDAPLPHDIVVVDEMSMVALHLMARLLDALPAHCRLICVGDPDQLASVEAGAVMADITATGGTQSSAAETAHLQSFAAPAHPFPAVLAPPVVRLQHTFRFTGGIADLADAIRRGDPDATVSVLTAGHEDVTFSDVDAATAGQTVLAPVRERVIAHGRRLHAAADAGDATTALDLLEHHRLLCAHRDGLWGVAAWESRIHEWLDEAVPLSDAASEHDWYVGLPLLNTANQPDIGLANGDTGIVIRTPSGLRAAFTVGDTPALLPALVLNAARPMRALTIHKSQGSQFSEVTVVLPPPESPLLTRELLYTAISRARRHVHVIGSAESVRRAVVHPANRASGLGR